MSLRWWTKSPHLLHPSIAASSRSWKSPSFALGAILKWRLPMKEFHNGDRGCKNFEMWFRLLKEWVFEPNCLNWFLKSLLIWVEYHLEFPATSVSGVDLVNLNHSFYRLKEYLTISIPVKTIWTIILILLSVQAVLGELISRLFVSTFCFSFYLHVFG